MVARPADDYVTRLRVRGPQVARADPEVGDARPAARRVPRGAHAPRHHDRPPGGAGGDRVGAPDPGGRRRHVARRGRRGRHHAGRRGRGGGVTTTAPAPAARKPVEPGAAPPPPERKYVSRWIPAAAIVAVWIVVWYFTDGTDTLTLPGVARTDLHALTEFNNDLLAGRDTNPVMQFTNAISDLLRSALECGPADDRRAQPAAAGAGDRLAGRRRDRDVHRPGDRQLAHRHPGLPLLPLLRRPRVLAGLARPAHRHRHLGRDRDPVRDAPGGPGRHQRAGQQGDHRRPRPDADHADIRLPPAGGALLRNRRECGGREHDDLRPPAPRPDRRLRDPGGADDHDRGHRLGRPDVLATAVQGTLRRMARKTIIVGLNQTTLAALSIATLAAFVNGPGLGKPVLAGLRINDVGAAFVPGVLIVVMAVMLDRTTTAASERSEKVARGGGGNVRQRRVILAVGGIGTLVAVYLSRTYLGLAEFPVYTIGDKIAEGVNEAMDWVTSTFGGITGAFKDFITNWFLNPMQNLIAESPWYVSFIAIAALAFVFGGSRALVSTLICLTGIWYFDLWHDAMITLTMTLVATVLVMILALVFGVWMARDRKVDFGIRPFLDAGQTIPPFVYLIPVLALFGPSRFTAIVAGVV